MSEQENTKIAQAFFDGFNAHHFDAMVEIRPDNFEGKAPGRAGLTRPVITKAGLVMMGILMALLLGACRGGAPTPAPTAIPTDVPTAAPTATPGGEAAAALEKVAQQVIASASPIPCGGCHTIPGVAFGMVGSDLSDIGARADEAYIRESIVDPLAVIAENCPSGPCPTKPDDDAGMPLSFADTLTEEEIDAVVWYLMELTGE